MESEIEDIKNEVMRKVGRNVIFFQQFELMVKYLVSRGTFEGYICDLENILEEQTATVMKQTLGQVTGKFVGNSLATYQASNNELEEGELKEKGMHISFSFNVECDEDFFESSKAALATLVAERNSLIHQFLLSHNLNSKDGLLGAEQYLDQQREELLPEYNKIKSYAENLNKLKKELSEYMQSGEMARQWKLGDLREEYLVKLLVRITEVAGRSDGWTLLNHAGLLIHQDAPDQLREIKKQYSCKTLKDLIVKTEIFDIKHETTNKGGIRILYRLKR